MKIKIVKESLLNEWQPEFRGDTPADQGARAARRDNAMRLFKVYEGDDYGRPTRILGIFKATSETEARELAAEKFNNKEIVTTGFYGADEISEEDLEEKKNRLQSELDKLNVVNESLNEGWATTEGRQLDTISSWLGYDDFHEMIGDNPGCYEAIVSWIDQQFGEQLAQEQLDPSELEKVGLYSVVEIMKEIEDDLEQGDFGPI